MPPPTPCLLLLRMPPFPQARISEQRISPLHAPNGSWFVSASFSSLAAEAREGRPTLFF